MRKLLLIALILSNFQLQAQEWFVNQNFEKYILIITMGESNSGGVVNNTYATSYELSTKPLVQLWDNHNGANNFVDLHPGTNSLVGHRNLESDTNTYHGWDLGLADRVYNNDFGIGKTIYLTRTGQGGSVIRNWMDTVNYLGVYPWKLWKQRVLASVAKLGGISKIQPYIFFSLGINDALFSTNSVNPGQFYMYMHNMIDSVRLYLPNAPFFVTKLPNVTRQEYEMNQVFIKLASEVSDFILITTQDQINGIPSSNHWDYAGQKTIAWRMCNHINNRADTVTATVNMVNAYTDSANSAIVHLICDKIMQTTPSSTGIAFSPTKTISSITRDGTNTSMLNITVSTPFTAADFINMSYNPGTIQSATGEPLNLINYANVANSSYATLISATTSLQDSFIYLTFNTSMTNVNSNFNNQFTVSGGKTITNCQTVSANALTKTLKLTLSSPYVATDSIYISWQYNGTYQLLTSTGNGVNDFIGVPVKNLMDQPYQNITYTPSAQLTNTSGIYGTTTDGDVAIGSNTFNTPYATDFRMVIQNGANYGGGIGIATGAGPYAYTSWRMGLYLPSGGTYVQKIRYGGATNLSATIASYQYYAISRYSGYMVLEASNDKIAWTRIADLSYLEWNANAPYNFINVHNTTNKVYYPQQIGF